VLHGRIVLERLRAFATDSIEGQRAMTGARNALRVGPRYEPGGAKVDGDDSFDGRHMSPRWRTGDRSGESRALPPVTASDHCVPRANGTIMACKCPS
jgi:hypothetical protein